MKSFYFYLLGDNNNKAKKKSWDSQVFFVETAAADEASNASNHVTDPLNQQVLALSTGQRIPTQTAAKSARPGRLGPCCGGLETNLTTAD